jgi:hypothetical protein
MAVGGVLYEVIRGHAGTRVLVHCNVLEGSMAIMHQGRLVRLSPVDLHQNARQKRAKSQLPDKKQDQSPLTKGSAQMAFERDMRPVIDTDGGFNLPEKNLKEDESGKSLPILSVVLVFTPHRLPAKSLWHKILSMSPTPRRCSTCTARWISACPLR